MILAKLDQLPKSVSNGPESWSEAFGKAVSTTDQVMVSIENINASQENFRASYQAYIDEVRQATGVSIDNPMDVDMRRGTFEARPNPTYTGGTGTEWIEERQRVAMERFEQQRTALMRQYPAQARLIQLDIDGRATRRMQEADKAAKDAMASPELGAVGRFAAGLVGGLTGSAKDPYQWAMAITGGGAGTTRTVAGRIGQVVLTEALVNGGTEAVLQAASQERKKRAGLEHGLDDALKNVGIAATFGALFGGAIQGGSEIARIYKLGEGGAEVAARVIEGRPQPGDVETLARAMNIELTPDRLDMLSRSFEERVLDEVTIPTDATPAQMKVYEAALRYAEDPDNNMPPDLVERLYAEEEAGRLSTLTADQYERAYGGDQNAIDDIADTFFVGETSVLGSSTGLTGDQGRIRPDLAFEPLDDGALALASEQAGALADPRMVGPFGPIFSSEEFGGDWGAAVRTLSERQAGEIPGGLSHPDVGPIDVVWGKWDPATNKGGGLAKIVGKHPEVLDRLPAIMADMKVTQRSENRIRLSSKQHRAVVRLDYDGEAKTWLMTAFEYGRRAEKTTDRPGGSQGDGHSSSPSSTVRNIDGDADLDNIASLITEPGRDRNGNPMSLFDFLPIEDGNGNIQLMSVRQALEIADEDAFHADLLEACKL